MNLGIESNNQQLNRNKVALLDKAQISLDALQTKDQEKVIRVINYLENFPDCSMLKINRIKSVPNYFIARAGVKYRIIFKFQDVEVTIVDIVNHDRLERLYGSLEMDRI
ncbi:hypothetical protein H6G54_06345 [Anabaena cylindrica FACHB-243]|uniref:Plasmid stabilization system n=1 Tax=Anabaena cylindrica (strain ATCC 27899 / PCC 7122) TaxID=272123 RepID=K9ZBV7_ANACC|nr:MULTISPECIES: hypothetical protein [Anabaena]AFZ56102.1 hypothetical protein Anacy_0504 [Anabaena cylindrica PCC 7122]MBD2417333.1 hypothetical protein [Anabaena cylindrica FACHB-243]MBY5284064.1 hypothetical protein [Anabaena sp. CCAP 1446/1C]MBY5310752.1 hypothetical protein [Anabaena sp. CCAP 1446/1C]MCM2404414.1 hypothetical protein [Anabaena sp. CCAP 1446/1C]